MAARLIKMSKNLFCQGNLIGVIKLLNIFNR